MERPAKPTGWYRYSFRFTLQASAEVELSAERVEQGGTVGVRISGMTGDAVPTIETDLGSVQCVRAAEGWRAYIPAAYNASSGGHEVNVTVNGETLTRTLTVLPRTSARWRWSRRTGGGERQCRVPQRHLGRCTSAPPPPSSGRAALCPRLRTP